MGIANRIVEVGTVKEEAEKLAAQIARYPQLCIKMTVKQFMKDLI